MREILIIILTALGVSGFWMIVIQRQREVIQSLNNVIGHLVAEQMGIEEDGSRDSEDDDI